MKSKELNSKVVLNTTKIYTYKINGGKYMEINTRIIKNGGTYFIKVPMVVAQALRLDNYTVEKKDSERVKLKSFKNKITIKLSE